LKNKILQFLSEHLLLSVILLNSLYFIFYLLFFDPVWTPDDYFISVDLYGVHLDHYNDMPRYLSALYGKIVNFLLNIYGELPWHTILSYVWIFLSLCLMSYVILSNYRNKFSWLMVNILLLFFAYEGYSVMQWTRTSAIALGTGAFAFFFPTKGKIQKILGIFLFFIGAFIRTGNVKMVVGVWGLTFGMLFIFHILKGRYDLSKWAFLNGLKVVALFVLFNISLNITNNILNEESEEWATFRKWDSYRANVQDYPNPSYDDYKEIYEKYGVSKTEFLFVYSWGFDVYNYELYENIVMAKKEIQQLELTESSDKASVYFDNLSSAFHVYPLSLLKVDVFYCYLILIIILLFALENKNSFIYIAFTFALLVGLNLYLKLNGRYMIHRVDVGIIFTICMILLFLYLYRKSDVVEKKMNYKIVLPLISLYMLLVPYKQFNDEYDTFSPSDLANNRIFYENTAGDDHFYLFVNSRRDTNRKSFAYDIYDVPKVGFMKNIFGLIFASPELQEMYKEDYGIEDPYLDIIDNPEMYLARGTSMEMLSETVEYISEKSGIKVDAVCVKQFLGKSLYRINSQDITDVYAFANVIEDTSKVNEDLQLTIKKGKLKLAGSVYIEGENDFYQNVYIDIVDSQTKEHQLFYTLQMLNEEYEIGTSGWCSNISAEIQLPKFYDADDEIYLMIETLDAAYKYPCGLLN